MSTRILFHALLVAALAAAGPSGCGPKKQTVNATPKSAPAAAPAASSNAAPSAAPNADSSTVSVSLAAENVPSGLKAGDSVRVLGVTGKTVAPNGRTIYRTLNIVDNATVVSVKSDPKPPTPEQA